MGLDDGASKAGGGDATLRDERCSARVGVVGAEESDDSGLSRRTLPSLCGAARLTLPLALNGLFPALALSVLAGGSEADWGAAKRDAHRDEENEHYTSTMHHTTSHTTHLAPRGSSSFPPPTPAED